eukprot:COSAG06_NODE_21735_length_747_cov_1.109568_1_plen_50_part_01
MRKVLTSIGLIVTCEKTALVLRFFVCLPRACLGKTIIANVKTQPKRALCP